MPGDIRPSASANAMIEDHVKSLVPDAPLSRRGFVVTSLSVGFAAAAMPVQAQTMVTTDMYGIEAGEAKIPVADGTIPGYWAAPTTGKAPYPTVLVIQEIFGVHEHIKDVCRRFAKEGYFAIAPELYSRQGDPSKISDIPTLIAQIVNKVPDKQVWSDLDAAVAFAGKTGKANIDKLGVTGFCWGGREVWMYTAHSPRVKAAVAWYGPVVRPATELQPTNPIDIAKDLKAPVLGLYGGADQGIPNDSVDKMRAALKAANKPSEIITYPDTPHGFHADYRPSFRKAQAEEGWSKLLAWFRKNGVA